ncbi:MAG: STAS domain-containing protein [Holophaga sp.]|nr:STAS domain-containing protein [Holophaga sp.]
MLRIVQSTHEDEAAWALAGEFTIHDVVDAKARLCAALDQSARLQLDLSGIERLDTAGVQLLVWLDQEARHKGKALSLSGPSPAVAEVCHLLQVTGLFGDPSIAPPVA